MPKRKPEPKPAPQTAAQRKAAQRARNKEMGLVEYDVLIPDTPEARKKTRDYCARLTKQYLK